MPPIRQDLQVDGIPIVRLESDNLQVDLAPDVGGRIISLTERRSGHQFLWRNQGLKLKLLRSGSDYDPNFYGGIDELLPNDIPETISDVSCPDHGELWTTALECEVEEERLVLRGTLPRFGLNYERRTTLRADIPELELDYRISNPTDRQRQFLWKLHAAVAVQAGDIIDCPAGKGQVVDLAYSRQKTLAPFPWPTLAGQAVNVVPERDGTMDFFYLFDLRSGQVAWRRPKANLRLTYSFDTKVFPYVWLFASYGGFLGHYTVVLEPCTAMPISVNEAAAKHQCSALGPGQCLETKVILYAGTDE
jgi:hypothetical protein